MNLMIRTTVSFSLSIFMVVQGLAFYPWQNKKDKGESTSTLDRVGGQRSASFSQDDNKAQMKLTAPIKLTTQGINRGAHYSTKKLDSTESGRLFGSESKQNGKLPTLKIDIKPTLTGQAISNFKVVLKGKIRRFSVDFQLRGEKKGNTWQLNLSVGDEVLDTKNILVKKSENSQKVTIEMDMQEFQNAGFKSLDKVTVYTKQKSTVELRPTETRLKREDLKRQLAHQTFDISEQNPEDGKWYTVESLDRFNRPDPTFTHATHYEIGIVPVKGSKNPPTSIIEVKGEKGTLFVKVVINKKNEISVFSGGDLKNLKEDKNISSLSLVKSREYYESEFPKDTNVASIMIPKKLMFAIAGERLTQYKITAQVPNIEIRGRHRAFGPSRN